MPSSAFSRPTRRRRRPQSNGDALVMITLPPVHRWPRALSTRRLILLATVANLGVAALVIGPGGFPQTLLPTFSTAAAQGAQRPVGFGDLVEKVKPTVISVRVKMDAGAKMMGFDGDTPLPNSRMEQFFRRFGMPDSGRTPDDKRGAHRSMTGQGSGFFITADGYAVTSNHVVDKAQA